VIVGPSGEEIYVDKFARVKVQFFWDRVGKKDENSSCWIRVVEQTAGKGWGMIVHPRIGQEVVVEFLEGDPDRPIVTGRVYNAEQMPPYPLPGSSVVMGLKSKTYKGTGYNEMSFDDTTSKEKITVHGQYDMNTTIEHDQTLLVKNDRTDTIKGKHTETITKDTQITIEQGNLTHKVNTGTADYYVKSDLTEKYDSNQTTDVTASQKTTVGNNIDIQAKSGYIHIEAATEIQLKVGSSTLLMKSDGSIKLTGVNIGVDASTQLNLHGGDLISKADGNHLISGGLVKSTADGANTVKGATVLLNP
jgi:type VI secretion system secreted protein VgrG